MRRAFPLIVSLLLVRSVFAQTEAQLTNLPTVYITTHSGEEPYDKVHELRCRVVIVNGNDRLIDSAAIRERGNYSRGFPKKPYHLRFDTKHSVLGSPATAKRWTLINNYGDKTLMRNLLAFDLSRRLQMPYTPFGTPVDVVLNGDYKGCYQLCDQVHVHKNRVEVDEGGFFIEADAYAYDEDLWFTSNKGTPVSIHYPDAEDITSSRWDSIVAAFNDVERSSHPNLDYETFLRHFLVGEISGNTDTYWSTYFYKQSSSDSIFIGPVWDFDIAFENDNRTYPICSNPDFIYRTTGSCAGDMRRFADNVVQKSKGKERLESLYAHYRDNGALSAEAIIAVIDSLEELIAESADLNFKRWPILNKCVHQNPRAGGSYAQEVQWVREYIAARIPWMDNKLHYTPSSEALDQVPADQDFFPSDEYPGLSPFLSGEGRGEAGRLILLEGQIFILRSGHLYTPTGLLVR